MTLSSVAGAEEIPASVQEPARPLPPLQVIEGIMIEKEGRTITYQRVVPPVLPPRPAATPTPVMDPARAPALAAERQRRAAKKSGTVVFTATVYDQRVTELRWRQQGREYRAWSNIDFNHFAAVRELETTDCIYQLLVAVTNQTITQAEAINRSIAERGLPAGLLKQLPPPERFPTDHSGYVLLENPAAGPPSAEATALLETLHTYYDASRQTLAEQAAQRTAEQAAREQWLKDHPPVPRDITISFWPKQFPPANTSGK